MRTVTQRMVADKLGVHSTTVSMAMRGDPSIPAATRQKILTTARKLGYQPNALARNLRYRTTKLIGMISPFQRWDVGNRRLLATSLLIHERGYDLMTYTPKSGVEFFEQALSSLQSHQVAGIILCSGGTSKVPEILAEWMKNDRPIVFFEPWGLEPRNVVGVDLVEAYRQAVHHLASMGHREISLSLKSGSNTPISGIHTRLEGFKKGVAEAGLPFREEMVLFYQTESREEVARAMKRMMGLTPRPTAMVGFADINALLCIQQLMRLGYRVPRDISVIGFDNDLAGEVSPIPLTTLAQPVEALAKLTVDKLLDMIEGRCPKRFFVISLPPQLIIRETTGPYDVP
jgi:DNA-binding LacI/PurR family transcriptional regulator